MKLLNVLLIVLLVPLPFFLSSYISIFDSNFYNKEFEKLNVPFENADDFNKEVLDYLKDNQENMPDSIFLNDREISHMSDVKKIMIKGILIFYTLLVSIFIIILYFLYKKIKITKIFYYSGLISLSVHAIIILFILLAFNSSFTVFHLLFFEPDSFIFQPSDNIIQIYPLQLFFDILLKIFIISILISILFIVPQLRNFYKVKRRNKKT